MYNTTSCYKTESDLSVFFSTIHNLSVEKMHTVEIKISFNSVLLNEIEVSWPLNAPRSQEVDHLRRSLSRCCRPWKWRWSLRCFLQYSYWFLEGNATVMFAVWRKHLASLEVGSHLVTVDNAINNAAWWCSAQSECTTQSTSLFGQPVVYLCYMVEVELVGRLLQFSQHEL